MPGTRPDRAGPRLVAVGSATPPTSYSQQELLEIFKVEDPRIKSLFLNGGIQRRYLTLPPELADGTRLSETQGDLLRKHATSGVSIGAEAVHKCLKEAGAELSDIGHLCCVSSTGFLTPGFSALLIKELGIPVTCSRLDVVGMGCNAGLNALTSVSGWAAANPGKLAVMVCVEVCSAAYVFDGTMRTSVVNSLFGDGAAAIALTSDGEDGSGTGADAGAATGAAVGTGTGIAAGPRLTGFASQIIPEAVDAMRYDWDQEHGRFSFFLDQDIPYVVGAHAERTVGRLLAAAGLRRSDIRHWVIHSGGKKVIDAVRINLGLTRHDTRHTTDVLRDCGNLSSGAFLFSYQRLLEESVVAPGDNGVLMTMGPGSTIETALLRW
ncbi:3,5-dihydroxyphenylacetyl-CoA synthase DpgA [Streptomyces axinellae]|uniref:3-oxoacyl-[acyl-carrier-protein] synthase III C-terminal domain-containing protein n=1 Tax=Streptomyces axinellae TaxID=552788 RepID=A0ABN3PKS5_9ACTN